MNDSQVIELLASADAYAPATSLPDEIWSVDTISREVERRVDMTKTQERQRQPATTNASDRRRWLVATAAFVGVLLVGVTIWLAGLSGDDEIGPATTTAAPTTSVAPSTTAPTTSAAPPTTEATTTSTAAPTTTLPVDSQDQAAIDEFLAAFNSDDIEQTKATWSADALVGNSLIAGSSPMVAADFPELIDAWLTYSAAVGTRVSLDECANADEGRIRCTGTWSDLIVETGPLGAASLVATFDVDDTGSLSYVFFNENAAMMQAGYQSFAFWLDQNYPGESGLLATNSGQPDFNQAELAGIRAQEYAESEGG